MSELTTISAILTSLKTATDIAKLLRESDFSLEKAELKLKFADLAGALADAKIELVNVQDTLIEKDKRIAELEEAFCNKDLLVRQYDAYYTLDDKGNPTGIPYCLRCWENDHRKRQLVQDAKERRTHICTSCGHRYNADSSYEIQPSRVE